MDLGQATAKGTGAIATIVNQTLLRFLDKGTFQQVGTGIGAFVGALFGGVDKIGPQLEALGAKVAAFFSPESMSKLAAQVRWVVSEVWTAIKLLWQLGSEVLPKVAQWGAEAFANLWAWLKEKLPEGFAAVMGFVRDMGLGMIDFGEKAEETFRGLAGPMAQVLEFFVLFLDGVRTVGTGLDWLLQKAAGAAEALHLPGAGALRAAASASAGVREAMGTGSDLLNQAAANLYEYGGYKRSGKSTGPRWVRDEQNADAWRDPWTTRRQNWMLGMTDAEVRGQMAMQRGFAWGESAANEFRRAGQVGAASAGGGTGAPTTEDIAYPAERGRAWGRLFVDVAEQTMRGGLKALQDQKARNTLRPAWQ